MRSNQFRILFAGDTSFGENYQLKYVKEGGQNILEKMGYDHPFEKLKPILLQSDVVVVNLETPITNRLKSPIPVQTKKNFHWTDVEKAPLYFKKYNMKIFSLANNHVLDYGPDGLEQTLDILRKNEMQWIGAGSNRAEARKPYIQELAIGTQTFRLAVISGFEYRKVYDQDFVFYANSKVGGVNRISVKKFAKQIKKLKESMSGVYIVVFPHWGRNYTWKSAKQSRLAHEIVDAGADLIIGHGSHTMQEIEKYNGRWILYGIGNFMFNPGGRFQKFNADPFGLAAQLLLHEDNGKLVKTMKLYPILTDNKVTNYQARFVTLDEFERVRKLLLEKSLQTAELEKEIRTGKDEMGYFMEYNLE